jgi:hypothetical protein
MFFDVIISFPYVSSYVPLDSSGFWFMLKSCQWACPFIGSQTSYHSLGAFSLDVSEFIIRCHIAEDTGFPLVFGIHAGRPVGVPKRGHPWCG